MRVLAVLLLFASVIAFAGEPQTLSTGKIIVQNYYYAKPGKAEEVYRWRIHASEVREKLGLRRGRVLRRTGPSGQLPDVIWECEYPDMASREAEVKILDSNSEFDYVLKHMDTLIDRFDRGIWKTDQ